MAESSACAGRRLPLLSQMPIIRTDRQIESHKITKYIKQNQICTTCECVIVIRLAGSFACYFLFTIFFFNIFSACAWAAAQIFAFDWWKNNANHLQTKLLYSNVSSGCCSLCHVHCLCFLVCVLECAVRWHRCISGRPRNYRVLVPIHDSLYSTIMRSFRHEWNELGVPRWSCVCVLAYCREVLIALTIVVQEATRIYIWHWFCQRQQTWRSRTKHDAIIPLFIHDATKFVCDKRWSAAMNRSDCVTAVVLNVRQTLTHIQTSGERYETNLQQQQQKYIPYRMFKGNGATRTFLSLFQ